VFHFTPGNHDYRIAERKLKGHLGRKCGVELPANPCGPWELPIAEGIAADRREIRLSSYLGLPIQLFHNAPSFREAGDGKRIGGAPLRLIGPDWWCRGITGFGCRESITGVARKSGLSVSTAPPGTLSTIIVSKTSGATTFTPEMGTALVLNVSHDYARSAKALASKRSLVAMSGRTRRSPQS
jgi:hypothetical protein